jgi:hypothetical protein
LSPVLRAVYPMGAALSIGGTHARRVWRRNVGIAPYRSGRKGAIPIETGPTFV